MAKAEAQKLADKAQGREFHALVDVLLTPPKTDVLGDTETALLIGKGLLHEMLQLLQAASEKEGFKVKITISTVVG